MNTPRYVGIVDTMLLSQFPNIYRQLTISAFPTMLEARLVISPTRLELGFRAACVVAQTAIAIHMRFIDNGRREALTIQRTIVTDSTVAHSCLLRTLVTVQSFFVMG